ncbi:hypothetical protein FOA52_007262 [Chlamydomonas sp. UWO 241]|nr:hypothetical protein FOA52_007262 [Chlamydomonas sp. UWO 241]
MLRLVPCEPIDVATVVPVAPSELLRSTTVTSIAFHPDQPLLAVSSSTFVAVFDLLSGTRLGRLDIRSPAVEMAFAPSTSMLIAVAQDWCIHGISLQPFVAHGLPSPAFRSRTLVPKRSRADRGLEACLIAPAPGDHPILYFCKYGGEVLRACHTSDARKEKDTGNWGAKLKLDVKFPILGLSAHPLDPGCLLLWHSDGSLRCYHTPNGSLPLEGATLACLYSMQTMNALPGKTLPPIGIERAIPHPTLGGAALLLQAERSGAVMVMEMIGRQTPPTVLLRTHMHGWAAVLGMGVVKARNLLLIFGQTHAGQLRAGAYRLLGTVGQLGLTLVPTKVDPQDVLPMLDQTTLGGAGGAAAVRAAASAQAAAAMAAAGDAVSQAKVKDAKDKERHGDDTRPSTAAFAGAVYASAAASPWQGLWAPSPAWATDVPATTVLASHLGPILSRVEVHPLGCAACLLAPSLLVQSTQPLSTQTLGSMTPTEQSLARASARVPLLALSGLEPHFAGAAPLRLPAATAAHASLSAWSLGALAGGATAGAVPRVSVSKSVYYASGGFLMRHSLTSGVATSVAPLPTTTNALALVSTRYMVQAKSGALLVFFETNGSTEGNLDQWQWTLLQPSQLAGSTNTTVWLKPGKYGAFAGPRDDHFVIVEPTGKVAAVFDTAGTTSAGTPPLYTLGLDSCSAGSGEGVALPVFCGPPCLAVLVAPKGGVEEEEAERDMDSDEELAEAYKQDAQRQESEEEEVEEDTSGAWYNQTYVPGAMLGMTAAPPQQRPRLSRASSNAPTVSRAPVGQQGVSVPLGPGLGVLMWQAADGMLCSATLPAAAGSDGKGIAKGQHVGLLERTQMLRLAPGEGVLQVAWQSLSPSGGVPYLPEDVACAVLTNQRVLLLRGDLSVHLQAVLTLPGAPGAGSIAPPATSMLWAGPMLLYLTPGGAVMQVPWSGAPHARVASVAPSDRTLLVGASPDCLLLLRGASEGAADIVLSAGAEVVARPARLEQATALGWATLAASGFGGALSAAGPARKALAQLLATADVQATPGLLSALGDAGCADAAVALVATRDPSGPSALCALAAAGRWQELTSLLRSEGERALHAPAPPPRGSAAHAKLIAAAAAAAAMGGSGGAAAELLAEAGEWGAALAAAASLDSDACGRAAHAVARKLAIAASACGQEGPTSGSLGAEADFATRAAAALRSARGHRGDGGAPPELSLCDGDGLALRDASGWLLAAPGAQLAAEVPAQAPSTPTKTVEPKAKAAAAVPAKKPAPGSGSSSDAEEEEDEGEAEEEEDEEEEEAEEEVAAPTATAVPPTPVVGGPAAPLAPYLGLRPHAAQALETIEARYGVSSRPARPPRTKTRGPRDDDDAQSHARTSLAATSRTSSIGTSSIGAPSTTYGKGAAGTQSEAGWDLLDGLGIAPAKAAPRMSGGGVGGGVDLLGMDPFEASTSAGGAAVSGGGAGGMARAGSQAMSIAPSVRGGGAQGDQDLDSDDDMSVASNPKPKFKISIRPAAEAAAIGGGVPMKALKLSGPPAPGALPPAPLARGQLMSVASEGEDPFGQFQAFTTAPAATPSGLLPPPPGLLPPPPAQPSALVSAGQAAQVVPPPLPAAAGDATQLYFAGVAQMEKGDWPGALSAFSRAMTSLTAGPQNAGVAQRLTFCAQYYAAVQLLSATGDPSCAVSRAARLYRYAAALKLDERHAMMLMKESARRNRMAGNNRYTAELLMSMLTRVLSSGAPGSDALAATMQADMAAADAAARTSPGEGGASATSDEDTDTWASIVGVSTSAAQAIAPGADTWVRG